MAVEGSDNNMETPLSKLQLRVTKLEKENLALKDRNDMLTEKEKLTRLKYNCLKKDFDNKIETKVTKAINDTTAKLKAEYEKIIKELTERIFKLEQRLNISSETSSLPPSQDPIWKKDTKVYDSRSQKETTKKRGGQIGHKKNKLERFKDEEVTEIVEYKSDKCNKCGGNNLRLIGKEIRDELDFEINILKIRHTFFIYECADCGEIVQKKIPKNLSAENQYGSNTQALGLALVNFGDVSYKRTRDIINGLTDGEINPSEGYLVKLSKRASKKLQNFVFDSEEEIVKSKVVQHDDGVIKIGKTDKDKDDEINKLIEKKKDELTDEDKEKLNEQIKKNFKGIIRAYTNGEIKLYKAHTTKDADTYTEDNILNRLSDNTTVVHDHMKYNYNDLFNFKNAECNIHPIRKGRGVKANTNHEWPDKIADLLEGYNKKRSQLVEKGIKCFSENGLHDLSTRYDEIIDEGKVECDKFPHKHLYTDETNLIQFFKKYKKEVLAWAYDFMIPFTNNLCETMIRLVKSKMKISYSFKNINTARYYADILSYTETCYNFGINRYQAIKRLFEDNPYTVEELKKLKQEEKTKNNN